MLLGDVPVQAGQEFLVVLIGREGSPGAGVITVFVLHIVGHRLEVGIGGAGNVIVRIRNAILRASPAGNHGRGLGKLRIHEEEKLVLDDGAAQGKPVSRIAVLVPGAGNLVSVNGVAPHVFVAMEDIGRPLEGVGSGLGNGVHTAADEVGLTDIVGRNHHLHFLNGVDGNGASATNKAIGETEVVVEIGAVHREVGRTGVRTGEGHAVSAVRRQAGDVRNAAVHRRDGLNLLVVDVGRGTGLFQGELGSGIGHHHRLGQELVGLRDPGIQVVGFSQLEDDSGVVRLLVTQAGNFHLVRTAGTHTLDGIATVRIGHGAVDGS